MHTVNPASLTSEAEWQEKQMAGIHVILGKMILSKMREF